MPLSIAQDPRRGWIFVHASGLINMDDVIRMIGSVRASVERRMMPMLFDAREARGRISDEDVEMAVAAVQDAVRGGGTRGHVAIVTNADAIYTGMLRYEARCADIGVRVIRVFRQFADAEQWLEIVSAARNFR